MAPRRSGRTPKPTAKYAAYKSSMNKKPRVSKPIKTAIARAIRGSQETKYVSSALTAQNGTTNLSTFVGFSSAITSTTEMYSCIPRITQGVGDHQRVGNQIRPTNLKVKGIVSLNSRASDSLHCCVDIYFLTSKQIKSELQYSQVLIQRLLNKGDGTNTDYNGQTFNQMLPINTSEFTLLKHKRILLTKVQNSPNSEATAATAAVAGPNPYMKSFSVKIPCPKRFTYQTDAQLYPASYYPFMVLGYTWYDNNGGSAPNQTSTVVCQAQSQLYFKDA